MAEFPESVLARKPELRPVVAALEQFAKGEPITATCYKCSSLLTVERVAATGAIYVRCPTGDTVYHQAQRSPVASPGAAALRALVTASDGVAHGLPGVDIFADVQSARMAVFPFPAAGMYVSASGPPGAPAGFAVWASAHSGPTSEDVIRAVRETVTDRSMQPVAIGEPARLTLDGAIRAAVLFTSGAGVSQSAWVGALVPHAAGCVLVALGEVGPMPGSVIDLLRHESLAVVARTFRVSTPG